MVVSLNTNSNKIDDNLQHLQALAWSPWQSNILATGGGTADRSIRLWNCNTGICLKDITTTSQVLGAYVAGQWGQLMLVLLVLKSIYIRYVCMYVFCRC